MAFSPKTWVSRIVQYPNRRVLTPTGNTNEYDMSRSDGNITQAGDILSAENLNDLEQRIKTGFDGKLDGSIISSGTWTPFFYGSTVHGSPTHSSQSGTWVRIGSIVIATLNLLSITSKGGMAGGVLIGGFPFIASGGGCMSFAFASGVPSTIFCDLAPGTNYATVNNQQAGMIDASALPDSATFSRGICIYTTNG